MFTLKLHRFLRAGFSVSEVMVGGAILAGIGLAGARMFKDQRQAQAKVVGEQELIQFHQMLTKMLQNENTCNATLAGAWNYNPTQMASFDIANIMDCTSCTSTNVDYDASPSMTTPAATSYGENIWINPGTYLWKITDISWKSTPDGTGPAVLKITYGQAPSDVPGWAGSRAQKVYSVSKDINLMLRFSQNTTPSSRLFKECVAGKQSSINNLQNDICGSMTQVTSVGNIMVWDDATQGCVARGTTSAPVKVCTDANLVIDGINADGTVRCRSLTYGVSPATDLSQSTGCLPGALVRMEYDTVTKRLKAKCD